MAKISAVVPDELHRELERQAERADRSVSAEVRLALRAHVLGDFAGSPVAPGAASLVHWRPREELGGEEGEA